MRWFKSLAAVNLIIFIFFTSAFSQKRQIVNQFTGMGYLGIGMSVMNLSAFLKPKLKKSVLFASWPKGPSIRM